MRLKLSLLFLIISWLIYPCFGQQAHNLQDTRFSKHRIIVKLNQEVLRAEDQLRVTLGYKLPSNQVRYIKSIKQGRKSLAEAFKVIEFQEAANISLLVHELNQLEYIEYAEPDYIGYSGGVGLEADPNDPLFFRQWNLDNDGNFDLSISRFDADIDMTEAWNIEQGDSSIIVAFLDSGLKLDHPEFANRIWINRLEILGNSLDDDQNGYADDYRGGWDFVSEDHDPADDHGHGTNVVSVLGANADNGIGFAGIDWNSKLMILKVINAENFGLYSDWAEALYYAADNGADVVNMSIGGATFSRALADAVQYASAQGLVLVACTMNTDSDWVFYPAGYPEVIAVGSTNSDDQRTDPFFWDQNSGSNFGSHIDLVAPGNYIFGASHRSSTNYDTYWGGTSQAVPHVSGICALLLAQDTTREPLEIREIITSTADDLVGDPSEDQTGFDVYHGHGRLNAQNALSQITTNVEREIIDNSVNIYPNPLGYNQNNITIQFNSDQYKLEKLSYVLAFINGSALTRGIVPKTVGKSLIHIPQLTPGVYILKIVSNESSIFSEKIIKY